MKINVKAVKATVVEEVAEKIVAVKIDDEDNETEEIAKKMEEVCVEDKEQEPTGVEEKKND